MSIFNLDETRNELLFRTQIIPDFFKNKIASSQLEAFFIAGPPGSGKTRVHQILREKLGNTCIIINTDDLRGYHPEYDKLLADPKTNEKAPILVNDDSSLWAKKLIQEAVLRKHNLVLESTFGGTVDNVEKYIMGVKDAGYKIELHPLIVHQGISRLGIYLRYFSSIDRKEAERFVSMKVHDFYYNNLPVNVMKLARHFETVTLYKRRVYEDKGELKNNDIYPFHTAMKENLVNAYKEIKKERARLFTDLEIRHYEIKIANALELIERNQPFRKEQFLNDIEPLQNHIAESKKSQNITQPKDKGEDFGFSR